MIVLRSGEWSEWENEREGREGEKREERQREKRVTEAGTKAGRAKGKGGTQG